MVYTYTGVVRDMPESSIFIEAPRQCANLHCSIANIFNPFSLNFAIAIT